jgi:hypothetical protein
MSKTVKTAAELKLLLAEEMLALGLPVRLDDLLIVGSGNRWTVHMTMPGEKTFDLGRIAGLKKIEKRLNEVYWLAAR